MYILYDQQFHICLYNYPEKLTHVHRETIPWLSRAAVFETKKEVSTSISTIMEWTSKNVMLQQQLKYK